MELTEEMLEELGWKKVGNKWFHEYGSFIFDFKLPKTLKDLVTIMTGTAFRKGQEYQNYQHNKSKK